MVDLQLLMALDLFLVVISGSVTEVSQSACPVPQAPINGRFAVYGDNLLVEFFCDDGFEMYGENFGACILTYGNWTINPPKCLAHDCPIPQAPAWGFVRMERKNSIAKFSCERRHFLMGGEPILYCLGYRWSGYVPICAAAYVSGNSRGRLMSRNTTTAETGMYSFKDALTGSDQSCSRYRYITPPDIANATMQTRYMFNEARRVWSSVANYTCDEGFVLENEENRYMFCKHYKWSAPVEPKCIKEKKKYDPCRNNKCSQVCIPGDSNRHVCGCHRGYQLNSDSATCKDINECRTDNGGCEHLCYNTLGSRFCACHEGYLQVGYYCRDIDECSEGTHSCTGQCINTPGSYTCNCTGISGYLPGENRPCKDLDECALDNGGCEHKCENTDSSYRCRCNKKGYTLSADRHNCTDVDECQKYGKKICHHGYCVNTPGSFHCSCKNGYRFHRPSKQCIDIDECKENIDGCEDKCINTEGSWYCVCNTPGLENVNGSCLDIDECETENGGCEDLCTNTHGSFHCFCREYGFVVDRNGLNCTTCKQSEYIDDRKKVCIPCPENSHTTNFTSDSSDDCICNEGFIGNPVDGVPCGDIDECSDRTILCDFGCQNTPGSAYCTCLEGYEVQNVSSCVDIDECHLMDSVCDGHCQNYPGSYDCRCDEGYLLANDSKTCLDINECSEGFNCSHFCINTHGSAECTCPTGYVLDVDKKNCKDINECETDDGKVCEDKCVNIDGSFRCECPRQGYKLSWDRKSCSDLNECQEGVNDCEDICVNTVGSFKCICNRTGYVVDDDGRTCVDLDECSSPLTNDCKQICYNFPGSYNCSCHDGYLLKGLQCEACPIGTFHDTNENKCVRCPKWSGTTEDGRSSMADCQCTDGYRGNLSLGITCKDINECEEDNFGCEQQCQNTEGSAYCSCRRGYNLHENKKNCTDIDECRYKNHFCSDICENSPGSYTCSCREGFKIYRDNKYCIDINECYGDNKPCDQHCENTWGSFICGCVTRGFILAEDGRTCIENRPKFICPEDIVVEMPLGAKAVKVELPSEIFTDNLVISPANITRQTVFTLGETLITVTKDGDGDNQDKRCLFKVHVKYL